MTQRAAEMFCQVVKRVASHRVWAVAGTLLLCGCGRNNSSMAENPAGKAPPAISAATNATTGPTKVAAKAYVPGPPVVINGQTVNIQKAERAITAPPQQAMLAHVRFALRYSDFKSALAELQKLSAASELTAEQKTAVSELMQEVKKAAAAPR